MAAFDVKMVDDEANGWLGFYYCTVVAAATDDDDDDDVNLMKF